MRRAAATLILSWAVACEGEPKPPPRSVAAEQPAVEAPEIMVAGCRERRDGGCRLPREEAALRVWVDATPEAQLLVTADGAPIDVDPEPVDGGVRLTLRVPAGATRLEVAGQDPPWRAAWSLGLDRHGASTELAAARARVGKGEVEAAAADLEAALPRLSGVDRLEATEFLAQAHYHLTQEPSRELLRSVVGQAETLGCPRSMARATSALVFSHVTAGELAAVEPLLDRLEAAVDRVPEASVWASRDRGWWAYALGDLAGASHSLRRSVKLAERLGMQGELVVALNDLVRVHAALSDWSALAPLLERLASVADEGLDCRNRLAVLNTVGWAMVVAARDGQAIGWAEEPLEAALALADEGGECPSADEAVNVRINLALAALNDADPAGALLFLEPVHDVPPALAPWVREVRARAGLRLDRTELSSSPLLRVEEERADDRWNAWVRQAELLESMGAESAAVDAWLRAEDAVEELVTGVALGAGGDRLVTGRRASAEGAVRTLVAEGRVREAWCRARLARTRSLRRLDHAAALRRSSAEARAAWVTAQAEYTKAREKASREAAEDWRYSADERLRRSTRRAERVAEPAAQLERASRALGRRRSAAACGALPRLAEGEAQLLYFPDGEDWWLFASTLSETRVARLGTSPAALRGVPEVLRPLLREATQIRVAPTARMWSMRASTVRVGEASLLDLAPLVYSLDLDASPMPDGDRSALVIADPSRDLADARAEADAVERRLRDGAWPVERLVGEDAARESVLPRIGGAQLLHYAGHGRLDGDAGWDSALVLAGADRLTVADVLALPAAPHQVVLGGCETGGRDASTLAGGMNLGRAFLLAGAQAALVADVVVDDALARRVAELVYEDVAEPRWALAASLRQAQLQLRDEDPSAEWSGFRVIVR